MREIKFRGKSLDNGEWAHGSYIEVQMRDGSTCHEIVLYDAGAAVVEVHPATVGQFTGLKDKDGREIYEGDILAVSYGCAGLDSEGSIEYGVGRFVLRHAEGGYLNPVDFCGCDTHVIGNIHENPELLNGGADA